ncbi:ECF family sigma factor [Bordetella ansorpii]|uniref:ECF family sigma factor n=1 Tax=Bordetella ansorpii TaxID=288768 RepID=A0A157RA22_9BORD|nr:sigma-70 family RNA polymerase sigma factor [Bordetella ansorpii]SAI54654.1 ECF family sigma factor [Bordetella ansorpii]
MSDNGVSRLRLLITERYDALRAQVARRLGNSSEMAGDALHDAYLRLSGRDDLDLVQFPQTYLVNTAVHVAIDRMRADSRLVSEEEVEALFGPVDESADPGRQAEGRSRLAALVRIMDELPPRQRALLVETRVHGRTRTELAKCWGISAAMVGREVLEAHRYCMKALKARDQDDDRP